MLTLTHELPNINPTPVTTPLGWDAIEPQGDAADRLAWHNDADANDWFDEYPGPGWQDADAPYVPTPAEEAEERGYQVGLTGDRPGFNEAFPGDPAAATDGRAMAFTVGRNRGNLEHANRAGYEAGLSGLKRERPASVHRLMARAFEAAWDRGFAEYCERQAALVDFHQSLEWDRELEERERELEQFAREAGGWDRVSGVALI